MGDGDGPSADPLAAGAPSPPWGRKGGQPGHLDGLAGSLGSRREVNLARRSYTPLRFDDAEAFLLLPFTPPDQTLL